MSNDVIEVLQCWSKLRKSRQSDSECVVRLHEHNCFLGALGQAQAMFRQLARGSMFRPRGIKDPHSPEHGEKLRSLTGLPAQFPRSGIHVSHFGRGKSLGGDQRSTQGELECKFLLEAFRGLRQSVEQFQPLSEMTDRFCIGRSLHRLLARHLPMDDRLLAETRLAVVISEKLRLSFSGLRKSLLQYLGNPPMVTLPLTPQQRLVSGILNQRVPEPVARFRRNPLLEYQLRIRQLLQHRGELFIFNRCDRAK